MLLTDEKPARPSLWNQALKAVKGDSSAELVEQFTQEMTLVAEGLCEDQARLRKAVDGVLREAEGQRAKSAQDYQDLLRRIEEAQKTNQSRLDELSRRISALEKPAPREKQGKFHLGADLLGRVTLLAGMICATWLLVTLLNLFM